MEEQVHFLLAIVLQLNMRKMCPAKKRSIRKEEEFESQSSIQKSKEA